MIPIPAFVIPLLVQLASKLIDKAFADTEKKPEAKRDNIYSRVLRRDRKAYGKMRGNQHV